MNAASISAESAELCPRLIRALAKRFSTAPAIALDMDGTITDFPEFFRALSKSWLGMVHIITARGLSEEAKIKTAQELQELDIYYDKLHLVRRVEDKPHIMLENNISVIFDDYDEAFFDLPIEALALKVRNCGNYENNKWYYNHTTGIKIGP